MRCRQAPDASVERACGSACGVSAVIAWCMCVRVVRAVWQVNGSVACAAAMVAGRCASNLCQNRLMMSEAGGHLEITQPPETDGAVGAACAQAISVACMCRHVYACRTAQQRQALAAPGQVVATRWPLARLRAGGGGEGEVAGRLPLSPSAAAAAQRMPACPPGIPIQWSSPCAPSSKGHMYVPTE